MSAHAIAESFAVSQAAVAAEDSHEYLTFRLGQEEYGIDILRVQEIRGFDRPTGLAGAPAFVLGVLNMRGLIVPIVDLRAHFGVDRGFDSRTVTMVINVANSTVGAVVDAVSDVLDLSPEQIRPAPEFNGTFDTRHITGIGSVRQGDQERMVILLDIEKLMTGGELGLSGDVAP